MAPRLKIKSCVIFAILLLLLSQLLVLAYLKYRNYVTQLNLAALPPSQEPGRHFPGRGANNLVQPVMRNKPFDWVRYVDSLGDHQIDSDIKVIKSPLGNDALHKDDGLFNQNIRRQRVFGFSTSAPLVINVTMFDKMADKSECSGASPASGSLTSGVFCLPEVPAPRMQVTGRARCLVEHTESIRDKWECRCKEGWYGSHCSIPLLVEKSDYPYEYGVKVMTQPRRIIYAFPFSYELEMLEARMWELGDVVDVFIIIESNYTAYGQPKPRLLWDKLQQGYLKQYQSKIVYVFLNYFPVEGLRNGWYVDELIRNYITAHGLSRLRNVRDDDVIVLTDADELPRREVVTYLKLHFGYPEPVAFYLRHNTFGFRWLATDLSSRVFGAATVGLLRHVFTGHMYFIRRATGEMSNHKDLVDGFKYRHGGRVHAWSAGSLHLPAGWHCSWCMAPERVRDKLLSAHVSDVPRWGSFPDKTKEPYIKSLIAAGMWFDDKTKLVPVNISDPMFAPEFLLKANSTTYKHLFTL